MAEWDMKKIKRPADLGFSSAASADKNVDALQTTLLGGGLIVIDKPGIYDLNKTIILDSNTKLLCAPGVVFRKTAPYCNVLINRGALSRTYDENIIVDGLEISVNGFEAQPQLVYGLRAQLGFFRVRNLTIRNFTCVDGGPFQYLLYIVTWERLLIENVKLVGDKDGIKLNNGHDAIIRNIDLTTYDDGLSLCGTDYASTVVEVGDVYNVSYTNIINRQYKNIFGRTCLIYTGSWADYADGNEYKTADFCLNDGKLYQCVNPPEEVRIGRTPPRHNKGIVTGPDGIQWRYIQECDFYHTDVYNVSFDNCIFEKSGNVITSWIERGINQRNYYPGTEKLSNSWGISINNCKIKANGEQVLLCVNGNMKDVLISNCLIDGLECFIRVNSSSANSEFTASVSGCLFKNMQDLFIAIHNEERVLDWAMPFTQPDKPGYIDPTTDISADNLRDDTAMKVNCHLSGNSYSYSVFRNMVLGNSKLRIVNMDIPFETLKNLSPEKGDICRSVDGIFVCDSPGLWRFC